VARGSEAATSLARDAGLSVEDVVVLRNSNTLTLRLVPCDVVARTAVVGQEVAALEVSVARNLGDRSAPIAPLDPRVERRVYERDDFTVTFWSYYDSIRGTPSAADYADALHRLHAAMRDIKVGAPHFTERITAAEHLVAHPRGTPELLDPDRTLLLDALSHGRQALSGGDTADQLLHGEPHPGNLLVTPRDGPLFIDLETCCLGPIEFDVAHAPAEVSVLYPGVDQTLLQESRRLVLAMVAAWRWDVADEFPDGSPTRPQDSGLTSQWASLARVGRAHNRLTNDR
jgi:aminoglycoside phosphotransferase (APT) family kinase protein